MPIQVRGKEKSKDVEKSSENTVFEISLGKLLKKQNEKIESYSKECQLQGKESSIGSKRQKRENYSHPARYYQQTHLFQVNNNLSIGIIILQMWKPRSREVFNLPKDIYLINKQQSRASNPSPNDFKATLYWDIHFFQKHLLSTHYISKTVVY